MRRFAVFSIILLSLAVNSRGQVSTASVNPQADSVAFADMRARMDRIRRTEHRPTVALVLSGGGAKGASHVGVIKYLEELQIPVDMVLGTSMGGLVGGLYALGYTPEELHNLLTGLDWNIVLSDKVPNDYISYTTKMYKEKFALSVPFHYTKDVFYDRAGVAEERYKQLSSKKDKEKFDSEIDALGARDDEGGLPMNTVWKSLPAGYIDGINVNSVLSEKTVGYQDSISFRELPIPFCCVASDMVSCCAMNWTSGQLTTALRSTMSIPGLFNPVRADGMVLVDGGTRNNFPTDLAREMGADYIIGVDLSDANLTYQDINNIGDILWTFVDMLGREAFAKNVDIPDVFIKPNLAGYNMMSFSDENIRIIEQRGYEAAVSVRDQLLTLKGRMPAAKKTLRAVPATDIARTPVRIRSIEYTGLNDFESRYLSKKLHFKAGDQITSADINKAVASMFATGAFESVDYKLLGSEEPYRLLFVCRKGPVHRVGVGFRADSEELVDIIFNVGLNAKKIAGTRLDLTGKLGMNKYFYGRCTYDTPGIPTFNFDFKLSDNVGNVITDDALFRVKYWSHREQVYFSNLRLTSFNFNLGFRNEYFRVKEWLSSTDAQNPVSALENYNKDYLSLFADTRIYTLDDLYYPTRGMDFGLDYNWVFACAGDKGFHQNHIASMKLKNVFSMGSKFAFITDLNLRGITNGGSANMAYWNYIGGSMPSRYVDQQIPFLGFNEAYVAGNYLVSLEADFRFNVYKDFFLSLKAGTFKSSDTLRGELTELKLDAIGAALELGYNSFVGPVKVNVHWSDLTRSVGTYFSFGYDF